MKSVFSQLKDIKSPLLIKKRDSWTNFDSTVEDEMKFYIQRYHTSDIVTLVSLFSQTGVQDEEDSKKGSKLVRNMSNFGLKLVNLNEV